MKKVLLLLVLLVSVAVADSALIVKKGWSLIGATSKIENFSVFDAKDVEQVWQYDATTQKWKGFSPDSVTQKKMLDKGYEKITSLESWHGFWIKSKQEWGLSFKTDTAQSDENITLQKGWNLISLPINSVVSPHIFDGKTVWKYAGKDKWKYFEKEQKENFPTISHITNSEGIWVKSDKKQTISVSTESAKLHNFADEKQMKEYIRDMVLTHERPICGYFPMVKVGGFREDGVFANAGAGDVENKIASPEIAKDASKTNTQEDGVDESDIIKHDGTNIFYIASQAKGYDFHSKAYINATTFDNIIKGDMKPLNRVSIDGDVNSIYLVDDKLVVLYNYIPDKNLIPVSQRDYYIQKMAVDIFDVSNISDIKKVSSFKIDGNLNSSRVVDGKLFLVTNFRPYVTKKYPRIYVDAPECKYFQPRPYVDSGQNADVSVPNQGGGVTEVSSEQKPKASRDSKEFTEVEYQKYKKLARCYAMYVDKDGRYYKLDYENPTIEHETLIPQMQKDSEAEQALISPETLYASSKKNQEATITTVSKFDISSANLEQTSSVLGYAGTIYASKDALYIVSNQYPMFYNFDRYKERSAVYKFSLKDELAYKAFGFVNGRVLNQFSLSEYKDILRIATTEGNSWQNDTTNALYTLSTVDDALLIQGALSGLGKEGEIIRSVRFMGDRAYVVTFKQSDPFYTLDLSDATNPQKVGELNISGYSSYLHPIDENHILGIGRDADGEGRTTGLKMELFNIEDFANPTSVATQPFGNRYSYSEMESNHKALAYRPSDKLLGFAYNQGGMNPQDELGVFQIVGDTIQAYKTVKSANTFGSYGRFQRGLIFDDSNNQTYIAFFSNGQIAVSTLDSLK